MNTPFTPLDMLLKAQNEAHSAATLADEIMNSVECLQRYTYDALDAVNAAMQRFQYLQATEPTTEGNDMNTPPRPNQFAATRHMHVRKGLPVPEVEPLEPVNFVVPVPEVELEYRPDVNSEWRPLP